MCDGRLAKLDVFSESTGLWYGMLLGYVEVIPMCWDTNFKHGKQESFDLVKRYTSEMELKKEVGYIPCEPDYPAKRAATPGSSVTGE